MIFYHISTDLEQGNLFVPRRPMVIMEGESGYQKRVCVCPSIELCLSAIPEGGCRLDELQEGTNGLFKVYRIDTEKLSIGKEDIVSWERLFNEGWVPDAEWTEEHWITTSFEVPEEDTFIIQLLNWHENVRDLVPKRIYDLAEKEYDGDFYEAYREALNDEVPSMNVITDIQVVKQKFMSGEMIYFISSDIGEEEVNSFIEIVRTEYQCELEYVSFRECKVVGNELSLLQMANALKMLNLVVV